VPIAVIRVYQQDPLGNLTSNMLFEYELPTNFHFCADLAATFSTIQIMNQQSIGFLFSCEKDKKKFNWHLENLQKILDLSKEKIKEVRTQAKNLMDRALNIHIDDQVDKEELLNGNDATKQAEELRKILILAGLDVQSGQLMDPTTVAVIQEVLANFDPTQFNEDEFVFDAQA